MGHASVRTDADRLGVEAKKEPARVGCRPKDAEGAHNALLHAAPVAPSPSGGPVLMAIM
jgi:hypothetical protein